VTTENTDFTSGLDQDQAQLDAVQEGTPQTADPMTEELRTLRQVVENQNKMIENQNRQVAGLQSKVDRGLNGMREQYQQGAMQQRYQAMQQYAQQVPEEYRAGFEYLMNENAQLQQQQVQSQTAEPQAETQDASSEWEQIYAIARSMGVDPQTPGIDYQAFTDPGLSEGQRRDRFFSSLRTVMASPTPQATTPEPTQTEQPQVQSPPQAGTPANGVSNNMRTVEQIERAYIEDKLSFEDYKKRLSEAGQ
jgi:hypothetical protein